MASASSIEVHTQPPTEETKELIKTVAVAAIEKRDRMNAEAEERRRTGVKIEGKLDYYYEYEAPEGMDKDQVEAWVQGVLAILDTEASGLDRKWIFKFSRSYRT